MNRTAFELSYLLLLLSVLFPSLGVADDEPDPEPSTEYRYEIASSPDAHMVYEDTHYFEIVSPESLRYTFKLRQAKDFGGNFDRQYKKIRMVVAEPIEACRPVVNLSLIHI